MAQIIIFEDDWEKLNPVSLTRCPCDIRLAGTSLYEASSRIADKVFVFSKLLKKTADKTVSRRKGKPSSIAGDLILLNSRIVPDLAVIDSLPDKLPKNSIVTQPLEGGKGGSKKEDVILAARCPASKLKKKGSRLEIIESLSRIKLRKIDASKLNLQIMKYPWDILRFNRELIKQNLEILSASYSEYEPGVYVSKNIQIHPSAVLDPAAGPIILGDNVVVGPYAVLEGPLFVGDNSKVHPHTWLRKETMISCWCKVGGEIEAAVFQPYSNKQHFGFIGHAFVGSWVNLGAGTTNSDLKNTYGTVKVRLGRELFDTGMQFMGCIIGDFCKTAINTSILTGKIIGVSSHLYGTITENVPSFTNYARDLGNLSEFYLDSAIETQKRMYSRRNVKQTQEDIALLKEIYKVTVEERKAAGVPKQRLLFRGSV
ncbi:hypothetical protein D6764_03295 [Candidatus Woesearchaeota archaeon]|nr:MAG: hypothetical protein D6764_03295 [Candidatus Woesearchaeota archaeon]